MNEWSYELFLQNLGGQASWGFLIGDSMSGKSFVANKMEANHGFKIVDMKAVAEQIKTRLGTEDEPFEGEVPLADIEKDVMALVSGALSQNPRQEFVFDGFCHPNLEAFL